MRSRQSARPDAQISAPELAQEHGPPGLCPSGISSRCNCESGVPTQISSGQNVCWSHRLRVYVPLLVIPSGARDVSTPLDMTKMTEAINPLREGLSTRAVPQPCAIVIFGATGDLTHRKLIPALYNLAADGELPPAVAVVGFARRPKTDEQFRKELGESTKQFSRQEVRDDIWKTFAQSLFYHQSEFEDEAGYRSLAQ